MTATVSTTAEQNLTAQELEQGRLFLEQTQNAVLGVMKGLSEAQWNFKPAPDHWSIAENLEHVVIVQERVLGAILEQLEFAPAPAADVDPKVVDAIVINQFPTRLNKFKAPEAVRPAQTIVPLEFIERLKANFAQMGNCLETKPGLRQHAVEAAPLKAITSGAYTHMDGYQWVLAAAAHTERHAKQMLEVRADPAYPA
jgi:hypothetical protein